MVNILLGWRGLENAEGDFRCIEREAYIKHNSKGFNDKERSYNKRNGIFRIVTLGDSFTWGYGVAQNEIFTSVLEKELTEPIGSSQPLIPKQGFILGQES